jgi:abhydrolase domain-containing protein 6
LSFQKEAVDTSAWGRQYASVDGFQLHYDIIGDGAGPDGESKHTVLYLHGYSSFMNVWEPLARSLADQHRSVLVDLPGHGLSDRRQADYSPQGVAHILWGFLDGLGVERVSLVGHSWGASIAAAMILERPNQVEKLVVADGWLYLEQNGTFMDWAQAPGVGEALYGAFYDQQVEYRYAMAFDDPERWVDEAVLGPMTRMMERFPGAKASGLAVVRELRELPKQESRYSEIACPALLVWCRDDRISHPHYGERFANEIQSAELELIGPCGHMPMIEQATRFGALVEGFL